MTEPETDRPDGRAQAEPPEEPGAGGPLWLPALLGVLVTLLLVALLFGLAFLKAGLF